MITYTTVKIRKRSALISVEDAYNSHFSTNSKEDLLALMLLLGGYNHMRKIDSRFGPDVKKVKELQQQFNNLLFDAKQLMNLPEERVNAFVNDGQVFKG